MKNTKILLALMTCFSLSCSDMEMVKPTSPPADDFENPSYPGTGGGVSLQTVQLNALRSGTASILSSIRNTSGSYLTTSNGLTFRQLKNNTGSTAFNYLNEIRVVTPTPIENFPYDAVRAQVSSNLNKIQVSSSFKNNLLSTFDYIRNLDSKTFGEFETYLENKLTEISTPKYGLSKLSENEKFALTQAYYTVLNITRYIYQNPTSSSSGSGCPSPTRSEWIQVAESAYTYGVWSGAALGFSWAVAGATATSVAGNPAVGAVVGGLLGFTTGFMGGALAGAAVKLGWLCVSKKLFTPMMTIDCSGKIYYANTASAPLGCTEISMAGNVELKSVVDFPLTPNKGKSVLNSMVVSDINRLLGY